MDNAEWWNYPYHKYMKEAKSLKTEISVGKYTNTYGPYEHDKVPRKNLLTVKETKIIMGKRSKKSTKRQRPLERQLLKDSRFRSHTARHSMVTCKQCQPFTVSRAIEENFSFQYEVSQDEKEDVYVKISIPTHRYYQEVRNTIDCIIEDLHPQPEANIQQFLGEEDRLATWIFTPSHGDR